jgi:hypothetical protein
MRLRRSGPCRAAPRHLLGPILGTDLLPDSPMFRNLAGTAYSKDALCRAFRKNLVEVLPGDKRKLMDLPKRRRSAAEGKSLIVLAPRRGVPKAL